MEDQEPQTLVPDEEAESWSEHVKNLNASGDTDGSIVYLENLISRLQSKRESGNLQLATAMNELAKLYTIRSDELKSRAFAVRNGISQESSAPVVSDQLRTIEASNRKQDQDQEPKTLVLDEKVESLNKHVENFVACGNTYGAISYLEHLIFCLELEQESRDCELSTAMSGLVELYYLRDDTIKSEELYWSYLSICDRITQQWCTPVVSDHLRIIEASNRKQDQDQEPKTLVPDDKVESCREHVKDLDACGDTDGAISYPELLISRSESEGSRDLELAALNNLAKLYYSSGDKKMYGEVQWIIRNRSTQQWSTQVISDHLRVAGPSQEKDTEESTLPATANNDEETCVDDWETLAEADISLLSLKPKTKASQPESGNLGQKETENSSSISDKKPKRKGRGTFLYHGSTLYSDTQGEFEETNDLRDSLSQTERDKKVNYATKHVLVLYELPTSTRTTELEKIFEAFDAASIAIRWVNDTTALAVFCNPPLAESAKNGIPSRYKFRYLQDDDELLIQLKSGDLEPPRARPQTSIAVAQRMIGHSFGLRISSPGSGIHEHRQQERERKERIAAQKASLEDAWGGD